MLFEIQRHIKEDNIMRQQQKASNSLVYITLYLIATALIMRLKLAASQNQQTHALSKSNLNQSPQINNDDVTLIERQTKKYHNTYPSFVAFPDDAHSVLQKHSQDSEYPDPIIIEQFPAGNLPVAPRVKETEIEAITNNLFHVIFPSGFDKNVYYKTIVIQAIKQSDKRDSKSQESIGEVEFTFLEKTRLHTTIRRIQGKPHETERPFASSQVYSWHDKEGVVSSISDTIKMGLLSKHLEPVLKLLTNKDLIQIKRYKFDREQNTLALFNNATKQTQLTPTQRRIFFTGKRRIFFTGNHEEYQYRPTSVMVQWYAKAVVLLRHILGPYKKDKMKLSSYFWLHLYNPPSRSKAESILLSSIDQKKLLHTSASFKTMINRTLPPHVETTILDMLDFNLGPISSAQLSSNKITYPRFKIRLIAMIQDFVSNIQGDQRIGLLMLLAINYEIHETSKKLGIFRHQTQIKLEKTINSLVRQIHTLGREIRTDKNDFYKNNACLRLAYLLTCYQDQLNSSPKAQESSTKSLLPLHTTQQMTAFKKIYDAMPAGLSSPRDNSWIKYSHTFKLAHDGENVHNVSFYDAITDNNHERQANSIKSILEMHTLTHSQVKAAFYFNVAFKSIQFTLFATGISIVINCISRIYQEELKKKTEEAHDNWLRIATKLEHRHIMKTNACLPSTVKQLGDNHVRKLAKAAFQQRHEEEQKRKIEEERIREQKKAEALQKAKEEKEKREKWLASPEYAALKKKRIKIFSAVFVVLAIAGGGFFIKNSLMQDKNNSDSISTKF